jgi:TATA-binding protein-associated factor Taf7
LKSYQSKDEGKEEEEEGDEEEDEEEEEEEEEENEKEEEETYFPQLLTLRYTYISQIKDRVFLIKLKHRISKPTNNITG